MPEAVKFEDEEKIRLEMKRILRNNKINVDKYLEIEYNMSIRSLIRENDDKERGKLQFIDKLRNLMNKA